VSSLMTFFEADFSTRRQEWEKALLSELKLSELGSKATREFSHGASWSTLSLERKAQVQLTPAGNWKKASTSYSCLTEKDIISQLPEDLKCGVKNFFFSPGVLDERKWGLVENELLKDPDFQEIDVFFLGESFKSAKLKTISGLLTGRISQSSGGSSTQELGEMAAAYAKMGQTDSYLGVFVDSQFFLNVAKIRAARLLAARICELLGRSCDVKIVALSSLADWTLYERYSNMLRNQTAVASAYIGGADHVQSSGYNTLFELETDDPPIDYHFERSQRMARNTTHILALESMLGIVQDAAYGSYHLENLTHDLCEKSWVVMQRILSGDDLSSEIKAVREEKLFDLKRRKFVLAGVNDFPDAKEELRIKVKSSAFFRRARIFEDLRLRMERTEKPEVYISLYGEYAALNARLNFIKNFFELLGLTVHETGESVTSVQKFAQILESRNERIIVLCATDEDYPLLRDQLSLIRSPFKYIAGKKFQYDGFTNIFTGQDIYAVLENLVIQIEGRC
jgi:hypothetical protein